MSLKAPTGWVHPEDLKVVTDFLAYLNENHNVGGDSPLWYSTGKIEIVSVETREVIGYAVAHDETWGFVPVARIGI